MPARNLSIQNTIQVGEQAESRTSRQSKAVEQAGRILLLERSMSVVGKFSINTAMAKSSKSVLRILCKKMQWMEKEVRDSLSSAVMVIILFGCF